MKTVTKITLTTILAMASALAWSADAPPRIATVIEVMDVSNYTYLQVEAEGEKNWIAAQTIKVSPGDKVEYMGGSEMVDFYSKSLDRTFASILFVSRIRPLNADGTPVETEAQQAMPNDDAHRGIGSKSSAKTPAPGEIKALKDGETVASIFAGRDQLKDTQVALRARVMKISMNISGKNWVTLRDGTGAPPADKLMVTTSEVAGVGELVTVRGVLHTDVDLGAGYHYAALLEEAVFFHE